MEGFNDQFNLTGKINLSPLVNEVTNYSHFLTGASLEIILGSGMEDIDNESSTFTHAVISN